MAGALTVRPVLVALTRAGKLGLFKPCSHSDSSIYIVATHPCCWVVTHLPHDLHVLPAVVWRISLLCLNTYAGVIM
eukprot:2592304-Amphidinium_carterae.1